MTTRFLGDDDDGDSEANWPTAPFHKGGTRDRQSERESGKEKASVCARDEWHFVSLYMHMSINAKLISFNGRYRCLLCVLFFYVVFAYGNIDTRCTRCSEPRNLCANWNLFVLLQCDMKALQIFVWYCMGNVAYTWYGEGEGGKFTCKRASNEGVIRFK